MSPPPAPGRGERAWIVLLRGINVGGRTSVPMARLRAAAEAAGLTDVRTYIQSGNLTARSAQDASGLETTVEQILREEFGLEVPALARSRQEWHALERENPFPEVAAESPARLMLALSKSPPVPDAVAVLRARAADGEAVTSSPGGVWIHFPAGAGRSRISPGLLDRVIGSPVTTRNWRTVVKLGDLLRGG